MTPTRNALHAALLIVMIAIFLLFTSNAVGATACSWDKPGANPYTGNVPDAVFGYRDIPFETRLRLRARMQIHAYDDIVSIERDRIVGKHEYSTAIRDMHFGSGKRCDTVTRERWAPDATERGLVYCDDGHCILVPTVCRNVSRIDRLRAATPPPERTAAPLPLPADDSFVTLADLPALLDGSPPQAPVPDVPVLVPNAAGLVPAVYRESGPVPWLVPVPVDAPPVPVSPVPEPETWALLVAGFAFVLWRTRGGRR